MGKNRDVHYISDIKKQKLLPQVVGAAKRYQQYLCGQQFLIISKRSGVPNATIHYVEAGYLESHFAHLVGASCSLEMNAAQFLDLCCKGRISISDFELSDQAELKLEVIPVLFNFSKAANIIGSFNQAGNFLFTEKIAGKTSGGCMGLVYDPELRYMVPNTVLNEDIRKITCDQEQILAIYQKPLGTPQYPHLPCHICKDLKGKVNHLIWPREIQNLIKPAEAS